MAEVAVNIDAKSQESLLFSLMRYHEQANRRKRRLVFAYIHNTTHEPTVIIAGC
jgi:hypothetical protein